MWRCPLLSLLRVQRDIRSKGEIGKRGRKKIKRKKKRQQRRTKKLMIKPTKKGGLKKKVIVSDINAFIDCFSFLDHCLSVAFPVDSLEE